MLSALGVNVRLHMIHSRIPYVPYTAANEDLITSLTHSLLTYLWICYLCYRGALTAFCFFVLVISLYVWSCLSSVFLLMMCVRDHYRSAL